MKIDTGIRKAQEKLDRTCIEGKSLLREVMMGKNGEKEIER